MALIHLFVKLTSVPDHRLSTGDWAILAVLSEAPTHGFYLAQLFARRAELGFIWTIQRPQIYRGLEYLEAYGFITPLRQEESEAGPKRTLYAATKTGKRALTTWLSHPVEHVREGRSELLLKLVFLERRKLSPKKLLQAQRKQFERVRKTYQEQLVIAKSAERIVLKWRLETLQAALRFIGQQLTMKG
jgi:DNA-binding PadR family transcriptional regulator